MEKHSETIIPYLPGSTFPIVRHGLSFEEACSKHLKITLGCSKAFVVASGSLSRQTDALTRLENALGSMVVGTHQGMQPHTLLTEVLELAAQVKACRADCLITMGGGTIVDAAKIVVFVRCAHCHSIHASNPQSGKYQRNNDYGCPNIQDTGGHTVQRNPTFLGTQP